MPNYEEDTQYVRIISHIMDNQEFRQLDNIQHHHNTRLNHSLKVSYYSYKIAKKLRLDYKDVARAGLLHDFYLGQVNEQQSIKDRFLLFTTRHPNEALINSAKYFELSDKEKDIIRTHMFPVDIKIPKYAESWLVSLVDKFVSTKEFSYRLSHRLSWVNNIYLLIVLRFMR